MRRLRRLPRLPVSAAPTRAEEPTTGSAPPRVLVVGLDPWGAIAAADLAARGARICALDDERVAADDVALTPLFADVDRGDSRREAFARAIARALPHADVSTGPLGAVAREPLALEDGRWDLVLSCAPAEDLVTQSCVACFAHMAGVTAITAHLDGLFAVMGPVVIPGETACWSCARQRRVACSDDPRLVRARHDALLAARVPRRERVALGPSAGVLGHALALAAEDVLTNGRASRLAGKIARIDLVSLESSLHAVLPMPVCAMCGGARALPGAAESAARLDDARDLDELYAMLPGVVDSHTGIVRRVRVGSPDSPHVVDLPATASAALGAYSPCAFHDHPTEPDEGSGKGATTVRAVIGAVAEAVERYSARWVDPRAIVRAPAAELDGDSISPARLSHYPESRYREPDFPFARIGPAAPLDWVRGLWLDTGDPVYLPALPVYYDYHVPPAEQFCQVTSNGLAAGPTLEEAYRRATLELIERDAFTISWIARRPGRRIALDDSVDLHVRELARRLAVEAGRLSLHLLDAGLGVPTVLCVTFGDGVRWPGAAVSIAAHPSPRRAIEGALLEHGQGGPHYRRLLEEGKTAIPLTPDDVHTLVDHAAYYFPVSRAKAFGFLERGPLVRAADLAEPADASLAAVIARVRAAGLRVAGVDLTSPDLLGTPFRVARAIGPDFQQIHFGHRLARLANPRLVSMCPRGFNPDPHPLD
jgi:ribosomal protein S12 methylthiotransferase accessory factor